MKKAPITTTLLPSLLGVFFLFSLESQAILVESFADGSCWVREEADGNTDLNPNAGPSIKLVSFNDNVAVSFTKDELFYLALDSDENKRQLKISSAPEINYHCGSYGHSVVVIDKQSDQCIWMHFKDGNWLIRSRGLIGEHESATKSCHGLKPGSLVLSIINSNDKELIKNELQKNFVNEIENFTDLSNKVVKINLKEKFVGSEKAVREKLLKNHFVGPRVNVEFNWFSHPVGEFKE